MVDENPDRKKFLEDVGALKRAKTARRLQQETIKERGRESHLDRAMNWVVEKTSGTIKPTPCDVTDAPPGDSLAR